ncbi:MAG: nucleoside-diphosphate kinase [Candidatus Peribacter sp.]|jgi:nucleoside-diphosphate kinase|nr:nucleoside-diphosphate kinase [Candidatus Peribacter sp.]MBT4393209.1 nucleoside-diphosphate kinase [Candidatus Peribacter sp.]MBT4600447.1 nucleoside-diphosphate kinase [Candidatus Peribacter sp.]MBT5148577.1 nucleoside-diphosphate kinase [Candidatus Peribacter sp.]MBT5637185.1 nucleoside-diphosphate kinase [Candidatus Peribacter sp.]
MEKTLILLKPDCVQQKIVGKVIARFEEAGFTIRANKMIQLTDDVLREHYAHIAEFPFYPSVEEFMKETPVVALVLEADGIIDTMREMLGVTDCLEADAGTIRADWGSKEDGKNKMCNIAHASDSAEAAEVEIKRFFSEDEVFSY